jgi:hypothetical protein
MAGLGPGLALGLALLLTGIAGCGRSPEAKMARYLDRGDRHFKQEQYRERTIEYRNQLQIDGNNAPAMAQLELAYTRSASLSRLEMVLTLCSSQSGE